MNMNELLMKPDGRSRNHPNFNADRLKGILISSMQSSEDTSGLWKEVPDFTAEDSKEMLKEDNCISESMSEWDMLPDVTLLRIFSFLSDVSRKRAALVCHRWHNVMRSPCLWRSRSFHFSCQTCRDNQSEFKSAVGYIRNLGAFLQNLDISVCIPRSTLVAQRMQKTLCVIFHKLVSVRAPLVSLSILGLELDRVVWNQRYRKAIVNSLTNFLINGASRLNHLSLKGMQNTTEQGLEILSALVQCRRARSPRYSLSVLDLRGLFSSRVPIRPNTTHFLQKLQGLTQLGLSYSNLSDDLLMALSQNHRGGRRGRGRNNLRMISLQCNQTTAHQVMDQSWADLVSTCPDLKVYISVKKLLPTEQLAKILLPHVPLRNFSLTSFPYLDLNWTTKHLLANMLPQYRRSLQRLTLDVNNNHQSVDIELLRLVTVCERLKELKVWAFLDVSTISKLLQLRLTKKYLLNRILVRIYSVKENIADKENQLREVLSRYEQYFPRDLLFVASIVPSTFLPTS